MQHRSPGNLNLLLVVAGIVACQACCGCSRSEKSGVVPVRGKVLLNDAPLKFGSVTLQPAHGQPARGTIDGNGEFTLSTYREGDGAAVGRHHVKIACYSSQDPATKNGDKGPSDSLGESLIPIRYTNFETSGLEVAVLAGGNKPFVFELKSEPPAEAKESTNKADEAAATAQPPSEVTDQKSKSVPSASMPEASEKK